MGDLRELTKQLRTKEEMQKRNEELESEVTRLRKVEEASAGLMFDLALAKYKLEQQSKAKDSKE